MAEKWIGAMNGGKGPKKGALHRELGIKPGTKIPARKLAAAAKKGGTLGRRARLAETLEGMHPRGEKKEMRKEEPKKERGDHLAHAKAKIHEAMRHLDAHARGKKEEPKKTAERKEERKEERKPKIRAEHRKEERKEERKGGAHTAPRTRSAERKR